MKLKKKELRKRFETPENQQYVKILLHKKANSICENEMNRISYFYKMKRVHDLINKIKLIEKALLEHGKKLPKSEDFYAPSEFMKRFLNPILAKSTHKKSVKCEHLWSIHSIAEVIDGDGLLRLINRSLSSNSDKNGLSLKENLLTLFDLIQEPITQKEKVRMIKACFDKTNMRKMLNEAII